MTQSPSSEASTNGLLIEATAFYLPQHSNESLNRFAYAYHIKMTNNSDQKVSITARHWDIIDANGHKESVDGEGVVGRCPTLEPGEDFEYHSFAVLRTCWGTMDGHYTVRRDDGDMFNALVGRFFLLPQLEATVQSAGTLS